MDYDELKSVSDQVVAELMERPELARVHSTLENSAPVVEVTVDAIQAKAAGVAPGTIGRACTRPSTEHRPWSWRWTGRILM